MRRRTRCLTVVAMLAAALPGCAGEAGGDIDRPTPSPPGPGLHQLEIEVEQAARDYLLFVPSGYDPGQPAPLVFVLHGRPSSALSIAGVAGMDEVAEEAGFLVVYPDDIWEVDDVGALLDRLAEDWNVATGQVYAAGFSAGGTLGWQLGARLSDRFAAVASVGGPYQGGQAASIAEPVSALAVVGLADQEWIDRIESGLESWRDQRDCVPEEPAWVDDHERTSRTVAGCADGSELVEYRVDALGHRWPPELAPGVGTAETIWEFFDSHRRA